MRCTTSPQHEGRQLASSGDWECDARTSQLDERTSASMARSGLRCLLASRSSFGGRLARRVTTGTKTVPCFDFYIDHCSSVELHESEAQENLHANTVPSYLSPKTTSQKYTASSSRDVLSMNCSSSTTVTSTNHPRLPNLSPVRRAAQGAAAPSIHFIVWTNANTNATRKTVARSKKNWCTTRCPSHDKDHEVHTCALRW